VIPVSPANSYSHIRSPVSNGSILSPANNIASGETTSASSPALNGKQASSKSIAYTLPPPPPPPPTSAAVHAVVKSRVNSGESVNSDYQQQQLTTPSSLNASMSSLLGSNESSAEQKRRCNIQHGFDRLQLLVPSLREVKNSKASKAAMLQKTSEYIKELQTARKKRVADLDAYKSEIDALSERISQLQSQLPANGVTVVGALNKSEQFEQKFGAYVKERTVDNW
jgi:hypothetical protein